MAKFGAITQLRPGERLPNVVVVGVGEAGGADHGVDAVRRRARQVLAGGVDVGEVDHDLGAGIEERRAVGRELPRVGRSP